MLKKSTDYRGRLLYGEELTHIHTLGVGQRLGYIRRILEEEYPGEFTRQAVANKCGVTYQGIRFTEEQSKSKPRDANVKKLVEIYNIPHSLLEVYSDKTSRKFRFDHAPIFIGKPDDHELYLKDMKQQQASMMKSLINYTPTENDLLEVDFEMLAYIPSTPVIHRRGTFARKVRLTLEDIRTLEELIGKHVELIASRREALEKLRKEEM